MVRLLLVLMIMTPFSSFAEAFYEQSEQGWYWYDVNQLEGNKETNSTPPMTYETAQKELEALKKSLDDKKALALMNPTDENIKNYIRVQNETNKLAEVFAMNWQKVIIQNPDLDHTVKNPTNAVGRRVYHEQKAIEQKSSVESLTSKYGLFFFFKSNCPYCHKFAPIMKMFEQEYGITVVPVSLDGVGLSEYPDPKTDNGISKKLNVDVVPAVIAVDPKTGEVIPISYGLVSVDELSYRINLLVQDERAEK